MVFEKHKIQLETLPEYLKAVRQDLAMSQEQVSKKTGVGIKIIAALEAGEYKDLPSSVYVKGFLAKLSDVYKIDKEILIRQYEIERKIYKNVRTQNSGQAENNKQSFWKDLVITPKNLSFAAAVLFVTITVAYIIWQVAGISKVPLLEIYSPQDLSVVEKTSVVVSGKTDPDASLTVNEEPVYVDSAGNFETSLGISQGPKLLVITAKNKFNKSASKTVTVIGQMEGSQNKAEVILEIQFLQDAEIALKIDGGDEIRERHKASESRLFNAKNSIVLSASDAGALKISVNGQNMGVLGRAGEKVENIVFKAGQK